MFQFFKSVLILFIKIKNLDFQYQILNSGVFTYQFENFFWNEKIRISKIRARKRISVQKQISVFDIFSCSFRNSYTFFENICRKFHGDSFESNKNTKNYDL